MTEYSHAPQSMLVTGGAGFIGSNFVRFALDSDPEIIVLGTGQSNIFAPRELVFAMARRGVGFEVMNSAAAARTFNVLAGEGRRVAAVLYLVDE